MTQFFIALFGLTAMALALSHDAKLRRYAPWMGIAGQPFWAHFAYTTGGWGLGLLVAAYTILYLRAIIRSPKNGDN